MLGIVYGPQKFSTSSEYRKTPFCHFWVFAPKFLTHPALTHTRASFPRPAEASFTAWKGEDLPLPHWDSSAGVGGLSHASFQDGAPPTADPAGTGAPARGNTQKVRTELLGQNFVLDICLRHDQSQPLRINQDFLTSLTLILCIYFLLLITYGRVVRSHHRLFDPQASQVFLRSSNHHVLEKRQRSL